MKFIETPLTGAFLNQMSRIHHPESARGIRWDDRAIGIHWPLAHPIVSARDLAYGSIGA